MVTIRISADLEARLMAIVARTGLSKSVIVRTAIAERIDEMEMIVEMELAVRAKVEEGGEALAEARRALGLGATVSL